MQQVWRKRWRSTGWATLAVVTLVLLVSAVHKKNHKVCKGVEVTFNGDGNNFFIEEKGVVAVLKANGLTIGQTVETIDLKALEETLKKDKWIADAELFFDNRQVLQVIVTEKTPVARIFTSAGSSFYIDSACKKLPLSEKLSARIPMFTSFPSDKARLSKPDSELLASVKDLAMFIQADDFWKAQVAQIDITPDGFEMIPIVGDHVVELGKDGDWQQKFDRLFSFYKQVWTKVGFEKYEKLDVQFAGQVVATVKGARSAIVDTAKVRKAYDHLLAEAKKSGEDSMPVQVAEADEANKVEAQDPVISQVVAGAETKRTLRAKRNIVKAPVKKERARHHIAKRMASKRNAVKNEQIKQAASTKQVEDKRAPKAVMKKPITSLIGKVN